MDFIESLIGRFRRKEPQPVPAERKPTPRIWNYEHFRQYLIALGRGEQFLLPVSQYPDIKELSSDWHELLDRTRKLTADTGKEHYTDIGINATNRSVHMLDKPLSGQTGAIPSELRQNLRSVARSSGVERIPGNVHSHPHSNHLTFSVGDLYGMVIPRSPELLMGVVDQSENLFAFRARESITTGVEAGILNQESFARVWYEQNGWKFKGNDSISGAEIASPAKPDAPSIWGLNLKIAARHNLVLYSGDEKNRACQSLPS